MSLQNTIRTSFILLFSFGLATGAFSQRSKSELETEKRQNLLKIAEAEKILSETKSEKKVTVGQLTALTRQIEVREQLISALNEEMGLLENEISELSVVVSALQSDLSSLKAEYAAMIYKSYKSNYGFSLITFLFSSSSFNQLYMRIKYLEQYTAARQLQAEQIEELSKELSKQRSEEEEKRNAQKRILSQQMRENSKLISLKNQKSTLVGQLSKKESQLRKEMIAYKRSIERLDRMIAELIKSEIEKNKTLSTASLADETEMSNRFELKKNKLTWPVTSGFITKKFGIQKDPILKNVTIDNTGIDIQTQNNQDVRAVFDGEVRVKAFLPGQNNVVILKHGNYYTVYSKLKEVSVKQGEKIRASDVIGKVHTNKDGISEIHFEVWQDIKKLDPEKWLVN